ncbi:MAG: IPT/TIG domain-containing protein [Candidatus Sericytochromatia bacterium]|nr:IPT/TIG domain-containing protein [Candidatus Tanganyikabacteria bacterium]
MSDLARQAISRLAVVALAIALAGCPAFLARPQLRAAGGADVAASAGRSGPVGAVAADTAVRGRVDWAGARQVQSTPADVTGGATVSFIETSSNTTITTGKTDSAGNFTLVMTGFSPVTNATYILEAVKGLKNQLPGVAAARFRTILKWNGVGWLSVTNAAVGGSIVLNALTTAVAIESALDPANVGPGNTVNKVNLGTNPPTLNAVPGPYNGHPDSEIANLANDLLNYLSVEEDPVGSIPSVLPGITSVQPTSAPPNALVAITGTGYSLMGTRVYFNGTQAQIVMATPTQLVVVVPSAATTGTIQVVTPRGSATSTQFEVLQADNTSLSIANLVPDTGRIDSSMVIQGNFRADATPSVLFKGTKAPVEATVTDWATDSLTVTVPLGAVEGPVSVRSGPTIVESLDSFHLLPGDINTMVTLTNLTSTSEGALYTLPDAIRQHQGAKWGSAYFLVGGLNGTAAANAQNVVRMFPINADGTLGAIRTVGRLNTARYRHQVVAVAGRLFVIGGTNASGVALSDIEVATINADGSLSDFAAANMALPATRTGSGAVGYTNATGQNFIYILGGLRAGALDKTYDKIVLGAAGAISAITNNALTMTNLTTGFADFGIDIVGSSIIIAGGKWNTTTDNQGNCCVATPYTGVFPIDATNNITAGTLGANVGTATMNYTQLTVVNGYAYVAGGYGAVWNGASYVATYYANVWRSQLTAGTNVPGAWTALNPLIYAAPFSNLFDSGGRLYMFGGYNASGVMGVVQTAAFTSSNTLDVWSIFGSNTYARVGHAQAMLGNKAWTFGGYGAYTGGTSAVQKTTEYFVVRDDGTVSPSKVGSALRQVRYGAVAVVAKGYVYVIGGDSGIAATPVATIWPTMERAKINADGTLGSFTELTRNPLSIPRRFAAATFFNGYIYVFGGEINGGASTYTVKTASIERFKVNDDGTVGMSELLGSVALPERRSHMQAIAVGEFIYLIGGAVGGDTVAPTANNNVLAARIEPGGIIGSYNRILPLRTAVWGASCARIGSYLYAFGGFTGAAATTAVQRAFIQPDGSLTANGTTLWDLTAQDSKIPVLSAALGFYTGSPHIYKNWMLFLSGGSAATTPVDTILEAYIL